MRVREATGASNTNQWEEFLLDHAPIEMRFAEFFDFANSDDPRDYRWVRSQVVGPTSHPLLGRDVLLATEHVRFETRTP